MISASLEGRLPYMTYPEPWRGQPKQPPEFLRPAPKPVPPTSRYNGINTSPNSTRLPPSQRTINKYPSPTPITPVNLAQHKDEIAEDLPYNHYRLFPATSHFPHFPPAFTTTLYQNHHYSHMMRPTFPTTPLPPLETYSPTTPTSITTATFLTPSATFNPPSPIKSGQNLLRDKRNNSTSQSTPTSTQTQIQQQQQQQQHVAFKVPSGKEGSLKHRILIRPEDGHRNNSAPLDLQQKSSDITRKRLTATMSPPRSPKKSAINNNNTILENFSKGSLIQLANGELRKIEDMRTEDFVSSAENSPELRLAESTVVRIEEHYNTGTATISLTYNQRRTQVNVESNVEHPFFVFGKGWSSCNPERTQQCYRLKVHQLQVGDILISLTPREQFALPPPISSSSIITSRSTSTIMTTATSTAMTIRQMSIDSIPKSYHEIDQSSNLNNNNNSQMQPINLHTPTYAPSISPDSLAASRKRRWSAPDQICDEEDQHQLQHPSRKLKVE